MMSQLKKNISLIATIAIIVIASAGGYYFINLKKGPYPTSSFNSLSYKWGVGDTLANSYDSATGDYQYLDNKDSLIRKKVKLNANNIIFLHSKANEVGLWELPSLLANVDDKHKDSVLRYEMVFHYEQKTKKIIFYTNYSDNLSFADQASKLQEVIAQTIKDAEARRGD